MADILLQEPKQGEEHLITAQADDRIIFTFSPYDTFLERQGDDLVFSFEDQGSRIIFGDFYSTFSSETMPECCMHDTQPIDMGRLFFGLSFDGSEGDDILFTSDFIENFLADSDVNASGLNEIAFTDVFMFDDDSFEDGSHENQSCMDVLLAGVTTLKQVINSLDDSAHKMAQAEVIIIGEAQGQSVDNVLQGIKAQDVEGTWQLENAALWKPAEESSFVEGTRIPAGYKAYISQENETVAILVQSSVLG